MPRDRRAVIFALSLLALAGYPAVVVAQSESGAAGLQGVVLDPDGRAISAAAVTVRRVETGASRTLKTDDAGHFAALALPVGTYDVDASAPGFATRHLQGLALRVGERQEVSVQLTLAGVSEEIAVVADGRLDSSGHAVGTSIGLEAISDLPIRGRNFTEFAVLAPGVMQEANRFGLVVNGQRSINSNISIDGVDFNDSLQGNQRGGNDAAYSFPQSAVREFQVVRSGASAEVGRTTAGFVNVVTKSGSNLFHGETFYANRNGTLTSKDAFGNSSANNSSRPTC
jgi:hypothetical protein